MHGPGEILPQSARRFYDRIALVTATRTLTYGELAERARGFAAALRARGVEPDQVVSLIKLFVA